MVKSGGQAVNAVSVKTSGWWAVVAIALLLCGFVVGAQTTRPQEKPSATSPSASASADPLIAGFARVSPANVSDAIDQIVGRRGFLAHDVRPYVAGAFVGRAATALVKANSPDKTTPTLAAKHSVEMIDSAKPGDVGVIVMDDSLDVAAMGGLMATAAKSRGMAGMVLDGAVRDVREIKALGLPVYARSISPANAVGRYASVANQVPVECAGVTIAPGDIIVASEEGVVVVPKDRAAEVLKRAEEIAARERKMIPLIKKFRSVAKAVEAFNWI
jgi:regulator of RNase E activity RraA